MFVNVLPFVTGIPLSLGHCNELHNVCFAIIVSESYYCLPMGLLPSSS